MKTQKQKALELMEQLGMGELEKTEFKEFYSVGCSFPTFVHALKTNVNFQKKVEELKERFNVLPYTAIYEEMFFGRTINFLIIPDYEDDWDTLLLKNGKTPSVYAYVWNLDREDFSEFGYISVKNENGKLRRVQ